MNALRRERKGALLEGEQQVLGDDVFMLIKPRQWWIFFDLVQPRTLNQVALRSGLVEASVRTHLRALEAKAVIVAAPPADDGEPTYRQAARLSPTQEDRARQKIRSARLEPARISSDTSSRGARSVVAGPLRLSVVEQNGITYASGRGTDSAFRPTPTADASAVKGQVRRRGVWAAVLVLIVAGTVTLEVLTAGADPDTDTIGGSGSAEPWTPSPSESRDAGGGTRSAPEAKATPDPVVTDQEIADQAFLLQIQSGGYPSFQSYPDEQLTNLGRALCEDLDAGYDPYSLAFQITSDADEVEAAGVVGAAIGAYCPQHGKSW